MDKKVTELPASRKRVKVGLSPSEVGEYYQLALVRLTREVKLPGWRPGKAPIELAAAKLAKSAIREEAYSLAVAAAWRQIVQELKVQPICDPETEVVEFEEGRPGRILIEFDIRPEVVLGAWRGIKLSASSTVKIRAKEVDEIVKRMRRGHASTTAKLEAGAAGDQVEVDFTGSIAGRPVPKLSGAKFPLVIGETALIPGFAQKLIGLKRGEGKNFSLDFPPNHFDGDLAA
ncbi:MAG: trigger factor, partial [Patescibacteria group bacterium]